MSKLAKAIIPAFLLSGLPGSLAHGQDEDVAGQLSDLHAYRQQVQELESSLGRFDPGLVEPMLRMADAAMELDQFDETRQILDRAVQIIRLNEGLYTESQFPVLTLKVENDARRGNWDEANATLEHLYWLYTNKHRGIDESVIFELLRLSEFHLEAVAGDELTQQAYHFRNAANISWVALRVASLVWGERDPRLAPIQYNLAKQYFLQAVAIEKGGDTGYKLREVVPGSSWVRPRETVKRAFYVTGRRLLRDMRENFLETDTPDLQAAAVASLYLADWQLLFTEDSAESAYQAAYGELLDAGVQPHELNNFFSRPVVLPAPDFYTSIGAALAARQSSTDNQPDPALPASPEVIRFDEWASTFPDVAFPLGSASIRFSDQQDWGFAMLSFSLGGLDKVSRWINGRYITRIGVPDAVEILGQYPEPTMEIKGFIEKIHYLHFRPRLIDGEVASATGTLQYLLSSQ